MSGFVGGSSRCLEVGIGSVVSGRMATFHPQAVPLVLRQAQDERDLCERDVWRLWKGPERTWAAGWNWGVG